MRTRTIPCLFLHLVIPGDKVLSTIRGKKLTAKNIKKCMESFVKILKKNLLRDPKHFINEETK